MRLFIALDLDESVRQRILRFVDGVREFAQDARWVRPESLHVTLKFVGEKPAEMGERIAQALAAGRSESIKLTFRGCGFFPTPRSARVFWIGIAAGPELARLAANIDEQMLALGIPREDHAFSPHLTLARGGGGSGSLQKQKGDRQNRNFLRLQEKLAALPVPEFGTMTAHEFFLYQSQLGPGGSRYTKLKSFALN